MSKEERKSKRMTKEERNYFLAGLSIGAVLTLLGAELLILLHVIGW
jgi:hypothetical protein